MRWDVYVGRLWRPAPTREARNEQKKAAAAVFNAMAIALVVAGLFGTALNPALAATLTPLTRAYLVVAALVAHMIARAILWTLEDK